MCPFSRNESALFQGMERKRKKEKKEMALDTTPHTWTLAGDFVWATTGTSSWSKASQWFFPDCHSSWPAFPRTGFPRRVCGFFLRLLRSIVPIHSFVNGWSRVSKKSNYFSWRTPSTNTFDNRGPSAVLRTCMQHRGHSDAMTVYWDLWLSRRQILIPGGTRLNREI